jgi:hypothetical protein
VLDVEPEGDELTFHETGARRANQEDVMTEPVVTASDVGVLDPPDVKPGCRRGRRALPIVYARLVPSDRVLRRRFRRALFDVFATDASDSAEAMVREAHLIVGSAPPRLQSELKAYVNAIRARQASARSRTLHGMMDVLARDDDGQRQG